MNTRPTVLVLDGQTIQALACVRALGRSGYPVIVASHRRRPLAASSRYCLQQFRISGQTVEGFATLRAWAAEQGVHVVLPLTERSCLLCNADRAAWTARDIILGCGPNDMLVQAFDKARTLQHAQQCGIQIPATRYPTTLSAFRTAARDLGLPCVIKARFSNVWDGDAFRVDPGVAYVTEIDDVERAVVSRRQGSYEPILQRYVAGHGRGVFTVCNHGDPIAWFAHERLRDIRPSGSGSSLRRSVPLDPGLQRAAERLLGALEWHGPAMLEFLDDGRNAPWLMEVNGRFWGSLHLAVTAGANFPVYWVRLLCGRPVRTSGRYRYGVTTRWLWGDVKRFLHIIRGAPTGYPERYPRIWQGVAELLGNQPIGTRLDTWDRNDPWPLVADLLQGVTELVAPGLRRHSSRTNKGKLICEPRSYCHAATKRATSPSVSGR